MAGNLRMLTAVCVMSLACCRGAQKIADDTVSYVHPGLGLAWRLPVDWVEISEGSARVFSGPAASQGYYTTLVLQSRVGGGSLDGALNDEFESLAMRPHFVWLDRQPVTLAEGILALSYSVQFVHNDVRRYRAGIVFQIRDTVVEFSYNAPLSVADASFAVYLDAQDSLTLLHEAILSAGVAQHL